MRRLRAWWRRATRLRPIVLDSAHAPRSRTGGRILTADRLAARDAVRRAKTGLWVHRDVSDGRWVEAKRQGGSFKGVTRER